eukprot:2235575-Alexandrium_andersonii.AAC.1
MPAVRWAAVAASPRLPACAHLACLLARALQSGPRMSSAPHRPGLVYGVAVSLSPAAPSSAPSWSQLRLPGGPPGLRRPSARFLR